MAKRGTYEGKMKLEMPFAEALERFIRTDPREVEKNIARSKKKRPPNGEKPSGGRRKRKKAS